MKCLILAAGYATRLYPLTENFPKPLLKVQGKAILDWLIEDMDRSGVIDEYVVISNHKFAHHFDAWAAQKQQKVTVVDDGTESNETRLGAVRDILFALEKLDIHDDVLVMAGDNLLDFSLTTFINYALEKKTSCIMRYYEADAKRLITTWGGWQEDYAARFWSGLIKDYYIPRIQIWFSDKAEGLNAWEEYWITTPWTENSGAYDDPVAAAKEAVQNAK